MKRELSQRVVKVLDYPWFLIIVKVVAGCLALFMFGSLFMLRPSNVVGWNFFQIVSFVVAMLMLGFSGIFLLVLALRSEKTHVRELIVLVREKKKLGR